MMALYEFVILHTQIVDKFKKARIFSSQHTELVTKTMETMEGVLGVWMRWLSIKNV